jgi:hypothetical protein
MIDWIQKQLDPPGLEKKNRGSLFRAIGRVFGVVRSDAVTAFNAHFAYLADTQKLAEHGKALNVPRFPHDTDNEYRERVSAASFFHMKSGERGYITEQLSAHFKDRFSVTEDFLQLRLEIADFTNNDKLWAFSFLDAIIDPNVSFKYIGKEKFAENARPVDDVHLILNDKNFVDALLLKEEPVNFHTRQKISDSFRIRAKYNGKYKYNKSITYNHVEEYSEPLKIIVYNKANKYNGTFKHDGSRKYAALVNNRYNASFKYDCSRKYSGNIKVKVYEEVLA